MVEVLPGDVLEGPTNFGREIQSLRGCADSSRAERKNDKLPYHMIRYLLRKINMTSNFEFILSQNSIQQLIRILNSTCNRIQNSEISQQTRTAGTMQDASSETITRATAADHARDWRIMQPTWAL